MCNYEDNQIEKKISMWYISYQKVNILCNKYGGKTMKFMRNHWYDIGLIPMFAAVLLLVMLWSKLEVLQRLALMNFAVIFWHQFEEYRLPGGEAAITNLVSQPSGDGPADRYPLNQNNAMVMNVTAAYIVYLFPVLFPDVLWVGFMPVVFGISQLIIHAVITPRKIGNRIYSPGCGAVLFGHVPVGIYWFCYTISHGLLGISDVIFGLLYLFVFIAVFMLRIGYGVLKSPNSAYPFPEAEFERGGYAGRIRKIKSQNRL